MLYWICENSPIFFTHHTFSFLEKRERPQMTALKHCLVALFFCLRGNFSEKLTRPVLSPYNKNRWCAKEGGESRWMIISVCLRRNFAYRQSIAMKQGSSALLRSRPRRIGSMCGFVSGEERFLLFSSARMNGNISWRRRKRRGLFLIFRQPCPRLRRKWPIISACNAAKQ